ncbi:MAG: sulfatase-like hydrolase/transferase [Planctomycetes bacterium]|nr:sulfatase-like hydrolase/transferase [Planctomycetota bacterium]
MNYSVVVVACLVLFVSESGVWSKDKRPPNIVLIMADDLGCETLGSYGGTSYKTPHLDRLAAGGMRFRHCYSMPVCHPTRVCFLTGRYPFRLGNPKWGSFPKSEETRTIAHVLKRAGYATAIAGKWQLTLLGKDRDHPHRLGFDDYCLFGWHEGPRYYQPMLWQNGKLRSDVKNRFGPEVYVEFLAQFMERNRNKPFFAFYSMALCHDVTDDLKDPVPYAPAKDHYDTYKEMVEAMDVQIGTLMATLDRLKLRENTLVLFTGDNGTPKSYIHAAENGKYIRKTFVSQQADKAIRGGKGELTNAGTNVPLIANWRGTIATGKVVDDLVDFSDFFATAADLAGELTRADNVDGQSFLATLQGQAQKGRQWAYSEQSSRFWVRTQRFKLYSDGRSFDVQSDPLEKKSLGKILSADALAAKERLEKARVALGRDK